MVEDGGYAQGQYPPECVCGIPHPRALSLLGVSMRRTGQVSKCLHRDYVALTRSVVLSGWCDQIGGALCVAVSLFLLEGEGLPKLSDVEGWPTR